MILYDKYIYIYIVYTYIYIYIGWNVAAVVEAAAPVAVAAPVPVKPVNTAKAEGWVKVLTTLFKCVSLHQLRNSSVLLGFRPRKWQSLFR